MSEAVSQTTTHKAPGREPLTPKRPGLMTAVLVGWLVGVLPYLTFGYRRDWFALAHVTGYLAVALLVTFMSIKREPTGATEEPSLGEWLLGACTANGQAAALFGLFLYGIGFWTGRLWNAVVVSLLGQGVPASPETIGFWVSVPAAAVLGLGMIGTSAKKLTVRLYPPTAGARSAYFPLLGQRVKLTAFAVGVAVSLVLSVSMLAGAPPTVWAAVIPAAILAYVALPLDMVARDAEPRELGITDGAAHVLRSAGYTVVKSPRTGNPEVDPLIQNVTLLACAGEEAFAIEITERATGTPLEWHAASGVRTASTVLQQRMVIEGRHFSSVRPILMMVGGRVAPSLQRFSEQEGVPIINVTSASATDQGNTGQQLIESFKTAGIPFPAHAAADHGQVAT